MIAELERKPPSYWILNSLSFANAALAFQTGLPQAAVVVMAYQRDAIAHLIAGTPVPAMTAVQVSAHAKLAEAEALATQFQQHFATIETSDYKDRNFYRDTRWLDPTPPVTVDPGPDTDPD